VPDPIISDTFGQGRRAIYEAPAPPPPPPARGRRFLLVGLPLIAVFAAFGSIMWLAYVDATPGSASRQPPLIRAEAAPLKVDPDDPGGRAVADQGELRGLIGDEELSREPERLLPPPEEPVRPPEAAPVPPAGDGAPTAQDQGQLAEAARSEPSGAGAAPGLGSAPPRDTAAEAAAALDALLADVTEPDATEPEDRPQDLAAQPDVQPRELASPASSPRTEPASPSAAASPPAQDSPPAIARDAPASDGRDGVAAQEPPVPPAVPPAAAPERQALAALGADQTVGQEIAPEPAPPPEPEPTLAPEPTATPEPTPTPAGVPSTDLRVIPGPGETRVAATDATYRIQLAAVRNEADARRAWGLFQNSMGDVVGGLDPIIERADTANGTFYRVQVGPFANLAAAESLCEQLKQRNASCFVIRR
jgi:cell division septation protein DedD